MKHIITLLLIFITSDIFGQKQVDIKDIKAHVGDTVTISAVVTSTKYIQGKFVTLLNLGAKYPNQLLTVVIRGDDRNKFKEAPEEMFQGKEILVTGIVEIYKDSPQINVTSNEQIVLILKG